MELEILISEKNQIIEENEKKSTLDKDKDLEHEYKLREQMIIKTSDSINKRSFTFIMELIFY